MSPGFRSLDLAVVQHGDSLEVKLHKTHSWSCWTAWSPGHGLLKNFFLEVYVLCQGQPAGCCLRQGLTLQGP